MVNGITVHELLEFRATNPDIEVLVEKRHLFPKSRQIRNVISVHARNEFASGFAVGEIQRGSQAFARPLQYRDASILIATNDVQGAICRVVINNQQLEIREGLPQDAVQRLLQVLFGISRWDNN
ncbi:hypothetical protein D9M68_906420 [compost metagenome]